MCPSIGNIISKLRAVFKIEAYTYIIGRILDFCTFYARAPVVCVCVCVRMRRATHVMCPSYAAWSLAACPSRRRAMREIPSVAYLRNILHGRENCRGHGENRFPPERTTTVDDRRTAARAFVTSQSVVYGPRTPYQSRTYTDRFRHSLVQAGH